MFFRLGSIDIWPHRKTLMENIPESYKKDFPNTIAIIDCTELKVQKPSSLHRQSQWYSDYKSCTILKGLVGVDQRGSVIFSLIKTLMNLDSCPALFCEVYQFF